MIDVINTEKSTNPTRKRGRPPAFDRAEVIEKAALCFWKRGYEGASIADLTQAMGITAQSLYAAFGSKFELYQETLGWYRTEFAAVTPELLDQPDILTTLGNLLEAEARRFADPESPPGCMISTALLGCTIENDPVAEMVAGMRRQTMARVEARLERGKAEGEVRADADANALARFFGAMLQGMTVQARDGADTKALLSIARLARAQIERARA